MAENKNDKNIHGHNFMVDLILENGTIEKLTNSIERKMAHELSKVLSRLDDALICQDCPQNKDLIEVVNGRHKLHLMSEDPTAWNLAKFIYKKLKDGIFSNKIITENLKGVKVWETPDYYAFYQESKEER